MYGGLPDMLGNKNPQLHMMNRTMNLPMNMVGNPQQMDALTLEQAVLWQAALSNGAGYNGNSALTVAMANEILRRNSVGSTAGGASVPFDLNWMNAQQQMATAAAAVAAAAALEANGASSGDSVLHQQYLANMVNAVYTPDNTTNKMVDSMSNGYQSSPLLSRNAGSEDSMRSSNSSWPGSLNFATGAEFRTAARSGEISLPDSLVDTDFVQSQPSANSYSTYQSAGNLWGGNF